MALLAALAAAGCRREAAEAQAQPYDVPNRPMPSVGLRELAPFPIGSCVSTDTLDDAAYTALTVHQCSQIIPEWQFQMEATLAAGGGYDFAAADRIANFARRTGLAVHATSLVWYSEGPEALRRLDGQPQRFAALVRDYISTVMDRYRDVTVSWDVVNEPVLDDGSGLRTCLFSRNLGREDYIAEAFAWAREANPAAVLVLNDYNLEMTPKKRWTFMRLVERLLKRGVPVQALGTQSHLDLGMAPELCRPAMRELASFGLPIRVSELDVSFERAPPFLSLQDKLALQARLYAEVLGGFLELPRRQQLAFAVWGLDDRRSWRRRASGGGLQDDRPCPFDDDDRPKAAFFALADGLERSAA